MAAACCRTLAPSTSPGISLHPPALRCARRQRGGCPRPASLLARTQPACTQRSKLPAPPVLRRRRAVSGRKSGDRRQGSAWRRAAPVWGSTRAAGPRRGVVRAANHGEGKNPRWGQTAGKPAPAALCLVAGCPYMSGWRTSNFYCRSRVSDSEYLPSAHSEKAMEKGQHVLLSRDNTVARSQQILLDEASEEASPISSPSRKRLKGSGSWSDEDEEGAASVRQTASCEATPRNLSLIHI